MRLLHFLFPVPIPCSFCDRRANERGICKLCMENLWFIRGSICEQCGRTYDQESICLDCIQRKETFFKYNRSALEYNRKIKDILSLYKFRGHELLAITLAGFLEDAYHKYYNGVSFDGITFVPLHEKRLAERGFNQAEQLAAHLSIQLKLPLIPLLKRIRFTDKQSKKQRQERLSILQGVFQICPTSIPLKRVLLIDDVYTTT